MTSISTFLSNNFFLLLSILFGALVGAAELIGRYRDEPFYTSFRLPGLYYLGLNGAISGCSFLLLVKYGESVFPGVQDALIKSLIAGFGSMVVMRSKLFTFKSQSGDEYAVGPEAVLSTLLMALDRLVDRKRSSNRQKLVYEEVDKLKVKDAAKAADFLSVSLASYQNLSNNEKEVINREIEEIKKKGFDDRLKLLAMSFGFLNISGEANFRTLASQLRTYLDSTAPPPK